MVAQLPRDIFHALADPTRRAILLLLAAQAMTPGALAAHFDMSRQAVSKHLQVLAECRVLVPQPQGREIRYHLDPTRMAELEAWLEQFRRLLEQRFDQLDEVLAALQSRNTS